MKSNFLLSLDSICFGTRNYALAMNESVASASRQLRKLYQEGLIERMTRGIWANKAHPYFTSFGCVPVLLGTEQGYISFLTALNRHGLISQLKPTIQVATTGHSRKISTSIGTFEFFQIKPNMMLGGVEWSEGKCPYRIASPEKALLDTLYLSTRKNRRFSSLPELHGHFSRKKLKALIKEQVTFDKIRTSIISRLEQVRCFK